MKKLIAFTLAETLIVMGIIGVVAALTLPNLNSSTGDKEKVAKVKKIYSDLNDAFGRAEVVYGPVDEWGATKMERLEDFFKISKTCNGSGNGSCFSKTFKCLTGSSCTPKAEDMDSDCWRLESYILSDGTSIFPYYGCDMDSVGILVDIDGPNKGADTFGKDIFKFKYLSKNGIVDNVLDVSTEANWKANCFTSGVACAAWIVRFDNMDYLKAGTDGKCKSNASIVLDGVSNITCK